MKKKLLCALLSAAMVCSLSMGVSAAEGEKVFRYSIANEFNYLDPNKANCIPDNEAAHATQENLVRNTAGEVMPGIAESWEISEDGLVYTFHLREAYWSDGVQVTANDFVYGLQRLMNPETGSEYAFIGEYVKNGYAVETGEMDPSQLGIAALDDLTVEITLENPTAYFLSLLGSAAQYAPVRQDFVEQYGVEFAATADKNVYCGPFKITSAEDQKYILEKNEYYWDKDSIHLDRVEISVISNADTALGMYENGELDYVNVPTAQVPNYDDVDFEYMNGNEDYFYINSGSENTILGNKNFRLALNYGLNRNAYIALATNNVYSASNTLVMPLVSGVSATYGEEYTLESYPLDGDQEKALEYLQAAMDEEGIADASDISVEITTTDLEASKKIAEVAQELWQQALGIQVTIRQVTYADIYGSVLPNGDYEIGFGGWGPDYSDPYTYLELFKTDCSYNYSNYSNADYDALLEASKKETDAKTRMDLLSEAEQIILDEGAFVPLQCRQQHYLLNEKVTGMNFYFCSINIDFAYADITE